MFRILLMFLLSVSAVFAQDSYVAERIDKTVAKPANIVGDDFSVISFEMSADSNTPVGEYSVFVDSASGGRSAVVGGIAVRTFLNPYSNFVLDGN